MSIEEYARYLTLERGLSPNTCQAYLGDLRAFLRHLDGKDPLKAGQRDIDAYLWGLRSKGLSAASLARKLRALRSYYRFEAGEGHVQDDPTRRIRSPRLPQRLPQVLAVPEAQALLRGSAGGVFERIRTRAAIELLYATGMRASELLGLKPEAVNFEEGWVRARGKGAKERMIPMHERARAVLRRAPVPAPDGLAGALLEPHGPEALAHAAVARCPPLGSPGGLEGPAPAYAPPQLRHAPAQRRR